MGRFEPGEDGDTKQEVCGPVQVMLVMQKGNVVVGNMVSRDVNGTNGAHCGGGLIAVVKKKDDDDKDADEMYDS